MTKWVVAILHQGQEASQNLRLEWTWYILCMWNTWPGMWEYAWSLILPFYVHICSHTWDIWGILSIVDHYLFWQTVYLCEFKCRDQWVTRWLFSAPNSPNLLSSPSLTDTAAMTALGCEEMIGSKLIHASWGVSTSCQSVKIQDETSWNQTINT